MDEFRVGFQAHALNSSGCLKQVMDASGNAAAVTWIGSRITKLTDGAGREISLDYNTDSAGNRTTLRSVTSSSGIKQFTYSSGKLLTGITAVNTSVSAAFRLPLATTAANVNIYTNPGTASTVKQALSAKGTRVCGFNTIKDANNKTWYPDHYACFCRKS